MSNPKVEKWGAWKWWRIEEHESVINDFGRKSQIPVPIEFRKHGLGLGGRGGRGTSRGLNGFG
jgi:hypothetical protein